MAGSSALSCCFGAAGGVAQSPSLIRGGERLFPLAQGVGLGVQRVETRLAGAILDCVIGLAGRPAAGLLAVFLRLRGARYLAVPPAGGLLLALAFALLRL